MDGIKQTKILTVTLIIIILFATIFAYSIAHSETSTIQDAAITAILMSGLSSIINAAALGTTIMSSQQKEKDTKITGTGQEPDLRQINHQRNQKHGKNTSIKGKQ